MRVNDRRSVALSDESELRRRVALSDENHWHALPVPSNQVLLTAECMPGDCTNGTNLNLMTTKLILVLHEVLSHATDSTQAVLGI